VSPLDGSPQCILGGSQLARSQPWAINIARTRVVEGGGDLVGVLFRVAKSQAADREIDDFMTVPRSRPR
jgi:hypothetical protein